MRGSEKQIAWANEIKERIYHYISMSDERVETDLAESTPEKIADHRWTLRLMRRAVEDIDYAGTVIEYFRDVLNCNPDDYKAGVQCIFSTFRGCPEMNAHIANTMKRMEDV